MNRCGAAVGANTIYIVIFGAYAESNHTVVELTPKSLGHNVGTIAFFEVACSLAEMLEFLRAEVVTAMLSGYVYTLGVCGIDSHVICTLLVETKVCELDIPKGRSKSVRIDNTIDSRG